MKEAQRELMDEQVDSQRAQTKDTLQNGQAVSGLVAKEKALKDAQQLHELFSALDETSECPVLIEQMAGHKGILGCTFDEVATITEAAGGGERVGLCLDSCHMFVSGYDIRTEDSLSGVIAEIDSILGLDRLAALHINDSKVPFGSRKDRHEDLGKGEIGDRSLSVFLSEPAFEGLPATLETPGPDKKGPTAEDVAHAKKLRKRGLRNRSGRT